MLINIFCLIFIEEWINFFIKDGRFVVLVKEVSTCLSVDLKWYVVFRNDLLFTSDNLIEGDNGNKVMQEVMDESLDSSSGVSEISETRNEKGG